MSPVTSLIGALRIKRQWPGLGFGEGEDSSLKDLKLSSRTGVPCRMTLRHLEIFNSWRHFVDYKDLQALTTWLDKSRISSVLLYVTGTAHVRKKKQWLNLRVEPRRWLRQWACGSGEVWEIMTLILSKTDGLINTGEILTDSSALQSKCTTELTAKVLSDIWRTVKVTDDAHE